MKPNHLLGMIMKSEQHIYFGTDEVGGEYGRVYWKLRGMNVWE